MLGQAGRQQTNGEVPVLPGKPAVVDGRADPVADFADGPFGQPIQVQARRAAGSRGLHIDEETLYADNGDRADAGNTHLQLPYVHAENSWPEKKVWPPRIAVLMRRCGMQG
jgi:hypothetical protein